MRLDWGQYLTAVRADGERLAAAARNHMNDPVPWCPGDRTRTVITANASDLDLWSWGRASADVLTVEGDPALVEMIRSLAAEAAG